MEYSLSDLKNNIWQLCRFCVVVSGAFLGIVICSSIASDLVEWITNVPDPKAWGMPISKLSTAGASVAFLVSTGKQVFLSIREYCRYVLKGEKIDFYKESISILTAILMLFLAYYSAKPIAGADERTKQISWEVIYLYKSEVKSQELAVFPIFFDDAKLDENGKISEGVFILEPHENLMRKLVNALAPCASPSSDNNVEISVEGYASSHEFKDEQGNVLSNSDSLNAETAYLRALNTRNWMKKYSEDVYHQYNFNFNVIDKVLYNTERVPPYIDKGKLMIGSTGQEQLNRSSFIRLIKAGDCQRVEPAQA